MTEIEKAAVLGAGTMGSGIAAHLANAGVPVALLDLGDAARAALEALVERKPPPLATRAAARLITPGSLEDDLGLVGDADWIVEAVIEDADAKRGLYTRLEEARRPGSIVSSNTSTIPLAELLVGAPAGLVPDFLVTHFFNPPRFMRLVELVAAPEARPEAVDAVSVFADRRLGKTVVCSRDTPAFIANRLGSFWIACSVGEAIARGLTVEEADALIGPPLGFPRTGVFGLVDLVGFPLYMLVAASLAERLPSDDPWRALPDHSDLLERLIAKGLTGRASRGGFYALDRSGGGRTKLALDLETLEYRPAVDPRLAASDAPRHGLRELADLPGRNGAYARTVLVQTLAYAAGLVPAVTDRVSQIDLAMELGYGWRRGPFAMSDELGAAWLAGLLEGDGRPVPPLLGCAAEAGGFYDTTERAARELALDGSQRAIPRPDGVVLLRDVKRLAAPLARNGAASLWDVGDGVACLEFHTKMNAIDLATFELIGEAIAVVGERFRALVLHNEAESFSVGANLRRVLTLANVAAWERLEDFALAGQRAFAALKLAPFPVVGAPAGMCLGGGCEALLHCDAVQAHADTAMGLVEVGVGIVPGWGGCKEMLLRAFSRPPAGGPMPPVGQVFELIARATVSTSAEHARELRFLRPHDRVTPNLDRVLADAKAFALELTDGYSPPEPGAFPLPGPSGRATLVLGLEHLALGGGVTEHDLRVAGELARVLTGGDADPTEHVTEDDLLRLERAANRALIPTELTLERMGYMLANGRPLRN